MGYIEVQQQLRINQKVFMDDLLSVKEFECIIANQYKSDIWKHPGHRQEIVDYISSLDETWKDIFELTYSLEENINYCKSLDQGKTMHCYFLGEIINISL